MNMEKFKAIIELSESIKDKNPPGTVGEVDCPICEGTVRFSRAKCNGHVHAKCETDNCISFME